MAKEQDAFILSQLNWRYATKRFDPGRKISDPDWEVLEETLRLSPSSYGLQPWKFWIVRSPDLRKKLTPASWGQVQIETCSHLVVVSGLRAMSADYVRHYFQLVTEARGLQEDALQAFEDRIVNTFVKGPMAAEVPAWAAKQTYLAMGTFMMVAAMLGIDTCPIEGISTEQYDHILGLSETDYQTVAVLAAGYRASDDVAQTERKVRFPRHEVIAYL